MIGKCTPRSRVWVSGIEHLDQGTPPHLSFGRSFDRQAVSPIIQKFRAFIFLPP